MNPDEVVAIGAAIQGSVLAGERTDIVLLDVTPLTLGIETAGGIMTKMIERNSTIPTRKSETFTTYADSQTAVTIMVYQGEREMARENRLLGQFDLTGIPSAPRGVPKIDVTFDIDANGIVNVSAKDQATNNSQSITITGSGTLDKTEVERMVSDAEANAEADKQKRSLAEAKNNADSMAYQVEKQISDLGDKVEANDKADVEKLIADVREKGNGEDVEAINAAIQALQNKMMEVSQKVYQQTGAQGGQEATDANTGAQNTGGDEVIDAEYKEE